MDGSAQEIELGTPIQEIPVFDEDLSFYPSDYMVCNFCTSARASLKACEEEKGRLPWLLSEITKGDGKYDCLIGLSGGVDSSTALVEAVRLGLRPLCFSIDNGYNDPKADENIMRLVETLKVPFYRYTIDLPKFQELQACFFKAGVINVEIPTDHILMAASYEMAAKYGIKWIISGGNVATESVMPASWSYTARDLKHIKAIYKKFAGKKLKGLPLCGLWKFNWYKWVKKIKTVYLLDFLDYNREKSIKMLTERFGFQTTGEKHEENIFTRWFQNFYLYEKFSIDKRKAHYSSMINSGQMTRAKAEELLAYRPVYPELGIESKVMKYQRRNHRDYPTDEKVFNAISKAVRFIRKYAGIRRLSHNII